MTSDESIVSKVLLKNKGGTVTVFAFDQGEGLSEHTAPFDALLAVLEGSASVDISGATYELGAGDTIVLPSNQPHAVRAAKPMKMMLVMIRG